MLDIVDCDVRKYECAEMILNNLVSENCMTTDVQTLLIGESFDIISRLSYRVESGKYRALQDIDVKSVFYVRRQLWLKTKIPNWKNIEQIIPRNYFQQTDDDAITDEESIHEIKFKIKWNAGDHRLLWFR